MDPTGFAIGVVGLACQLVIVSLQCYDVLSTASETAVDHDRFVWQLHTEKLRLEVWVKGWGLSSDLEQKLDPSDYRYRYAVGTLARITSLFASADSLGTKYGIQATTRTRPGRIDRIIRRRSHKIAELPALDVPGIETLENPSALELAPDLAQEINRLKTAASNLQKLLPAYKKLQWAVVDKAKSRELIQQLKEYNDGLSNILPSPGPQGANNESLSPPFLEFNIPVQLPVQRNQFFSGREDLLDGIHRVLRPADLVPSRQIVVLHGLGGMGKSQLAAEYAYRHSTDDSYTSIFWIDVTSQATLAQSALKMIERIVFHYARKWAGSPDFKEIGLKLGLDGCIESDGVVKSDANSADLALKAMARWLSEAENKNWLIIFDNNDDIESVNLYDFFPACDFGSIIITTRRSEVRHLGHGIEVEEVEEMAGILILLRSASKASVVEGDADYKEAANIARRLGYLPLALNQAGGYILTKQISLSEYLPLYCTNYELVTSRGHLGLAANYRNETIFTTWNISFNSLPPPASELLLLCAFLGNGAIPEELLCRGKEAIPQLFRDDHLVEAALDPLLSFSLAKRTGFETARSLSFHPLVLEWARESQDIAGRQMHARKAVSLVGKTYPDGARTTDDWAFGLRIFTHIDISVQNILNIEDLFGKGEMVPLMKIGDYCLDRGRYEDAGKIFRKALANCEKSPQNSQLMNTRRAIIMTQLGWVHVYQENFAEAHELFEQVLDDRKRLSDAEGHQVLGAKHDVAYALDKLGRHEEAMELFKQLLASQEKTLGKEHRRTVDTAHSLAQALDSLERHEEAVELYKQVIASQEKALGKEHPSILATVHNMAHSLNSFGRHEEAVELFKQVLASEEKTLGKEHPSTLTTAHSLAHALDKLGKYEEAVELYKKVLASREKTLGKEHPSTLEIAHNIAFALDGAGKYEEAVEIYKQVLASEEKTLGKKHPSALDTAHNLAHALDSLERYGEAVELYKQVIASQEKTLGKEHPSTLNTAHNLAYALNGLERYGEAMGLFKQVLVSEEKTLGKEHPDTLVTARNMARSLNSVGNHEEAIELYKQVIASQEKTLGKEHPDTLVTTRNMAQALTSVGNHEEAMGLYKQVIDSQEKTLGKEHSSTLVTARNIAHALNSVGKHKEAVELYKQVLASQEKTLGKEHSSTLITARDMAHALKNPELVKEVFVGE